MKLSPAWTQAAVAVGMFLFAACPLRADVYDLVIYGGTPAAVSAAVRAECTNLLVPVAVSATHAAFGSIRMEPVFFILGESAATAAAFAAKDGRAVQDVDVAALRERLLKDGQILSL